MKKPFVAADILLPDASVDLERWAVLACDQFTSEPAYWQRAAALCEGYPSALHITLPEVYLESPDVKARIGWIRDTMDRYLGTVLTRSLHGFVYVERTTPSGVRRGLVGAVDLETYSFEPDAAPLCRPSEATVRERIPPRLAVREGASLETPHILMLADDAAAPVFPALAAKKGDLPLLYRTPLMLGGGSIEGRAVTDEALIAQIESAVAALADETEFAKAYPGASVPPFALAVGDGNHSLATAKAHWEKVKAKLSPEEQETHPARYCLAEVCSVHDEALIVEPIHRVIFDADFDDVLREFRAFLAKRGDEGDAQTIVLTNGRGARETVGAAGKTHPLAVGTFEAFWAEFSAAHPAARVDFIHGEESVEKLAREGGAGVLMPPFAKSDLFLGVAKGGVLPKKTFSMGHAEEKRYYMECRRIVK